ncbi:MAG: DUF1634 domain-containing protein [Achromobacter sp.]|uniref:DUF1634 domain-containing protein n=1 Tax=Achromobacter sp. TaxID=134375 RepID=UPI0025832383|nr:DUF1634 domain-containing protein [Achromobacter sp.]MCW0211596.1 DUF1634 domain-containing protein [Achromobacter sp.]
MSPPGRPKGEYRRAQHEGSLIGQPGRPADGQARRDRGIAALLWYGTWAASACIALGMAVDFLLPQAGLAGYRLVQAGVALFILLPVARVALMLAIFLRERDYAYTAISALVLLIIAAGVLSGLR